MIKCPLRSCLRAVLGWKAGKIFDGKQVKYCQGAETITLPTCYSISVRYFNLDKLFSLETTCYLNQHLSSMGKFIGKLEGMNVKRIYHHLWSITLRTVWLMSLK